MNHRQFQAPSHLPSIFFAYKFRSYPFPFDEEEQNVEFMDFDLLLEDVSIESVQLCYFLKF